MDPSNSSDLLSDSSPRFAKWFLVALGVSLLFHLLLFGYLRLSKLERFEFTSEPQRLVPRPFEVKPAQIDPRAFEQEREVILNDRPKRQALPELEAAIQERPDLEKGSEKVHLTPQAEKAEKTLNPLDTLVNQKPDVSENRAEKALTPGPNRAVERELEAARRGLTDVAPKVAPGSKLPMPTGVGRPDGAEGNAAGHPGFSDLDELLTRSGPLSGEIAPVNMPGGALFEYDSAELLPDSIATLHKIGELVRRNPAATFSIEGHTDSFGSVEYNESLSLARAEAVKVWLVNGLRIDPARIKTRGYGSTRLLAPGTGSAEEQQINRRVEIVIITPQ